MRGKGEGSRREGGRERGRGGRREDIKEIKRGRKSWKTRVRQTIQEGDSGS